MASVLALTSLSSLLTVTFAAVPEYAVFDNVAGNELPILITSVDGLYVNPALVSLPMVSVPVSNIIFLDVLSPAVPIATFEALPEYAVFDNVAGFELPILITSVDGLYVNPVLVSLPMVSVPVSNIIFLDASSPAVPIATFVAVPVNVVAVMLL